MKPQIKYIELKSGYGDNGPAWIGLVYFSKTGSTLYFDNKAFKSCKGDGISGNYYDIETCEEYWISGVKKDITDRHYSGGGIIFIENRILNEYLTITNKNKLDYKKYKIIEVNTDPPKQRIHVIE